MIDSAHFFSQIFSFDMFIYERAVRLFFDLLHGIKRTDVPLIMMLEFMVFLGYDGKLDADSDMEKDLFSSALDQLKERFIILGLVFFTNLVQKIMQFLNP